ncbi:hypothetical protein [Kitasatospora purpeofusca]|uniref:hypothetical protein n=1 Tax=Kitasatospora purpeofusca TaxID=67352 RepID=UPI00381F20E5
MANPNKQKGTAWESAVRDYLNRVLGLSAEDGRPVDPFDALNVRRAAQEGAKDVGDVHAVPFILECKDVTKGAVPTFLRQAEVEAVNAGFPYGVAVVKVRRANVSVGRVHYTVRTWTRVRLALGLNSRTFAQRYGFTMSLRGTDTGRWYATQSLADFAQVLDDIRRLSR